jgi:sodium/hydrogen antiporter
VSWALVWIALAVLAVAAVSRRLSGTPVTPAMVFVLIGMLIGPSVLDQMDASPQGATVRTLAEATLALVLFSDAARIELRALRREYAFPLRLLGIGLPLTIVLGGFLAAGLFDELTLTEALVLAVVLAPTDAALGQAVVADRRLPSRIRQGINVESGLNDGICVPLLFIVLASAEIESDLAPGRHALTIIFEEIGYGLLAGVTAGLLAAAVLVFAGRRGMISGPWRQVVPVAGAALAFGLAAGLGGSGFIATFVAGGIFGGLVGRESDEAGRLSEEIGDLLDGSTFIVFGAVLLGPSLTHIDWRVAAYAVLSLTVVRMLPVAIAMLGTKARPPTVAFAGWFGPRGLASIVFAVIVVQESHLPQTDTILLVAYTTVGLSVLAHGITAAPLADRYARWYRAQLRAVPPSMESVPAGEPPAREPRGAFRGTAAGRPSVHGRPATEGELGAERPDRS